MKKVHSVTYNWHQVGSVQDRVGVSVYCERFTVGYRGVKSIEEQEGDKWTYLIKFEDGRSVRVFNPNFVEYKWEQ